MLVRYILGAVVLMGAGLSCQPMAAPASPSQPANDGRAVAVRISSAQAHTTDSDQGSAHSSADLVASLGGPSIARLLDSALRASGMDDVAVRTRTEAQFAAVLARLKGYVHNRGSQYRRARRLHDALHRFVFRQYSAQADGIDAILDRGEYNCVSATLFFGIMGRSMGLDLRVVETPHHVYLRLEDRGKLVDIETTSPTGYDFTGDLETFRRFTWAYQTADEEKTDEPSAYWRFERPAETQTASVSLEQATAFLWHNTAEKALARGSAVEAARCFEEEYKAYPQMAIRVEGFAAALAHAFQLDYEAGRFDDAFRIAAIEMRVFPVKTTSRDRMLAVASKRIEGACEQAEPALAEQILDSSMEFLVVPSDRALLERETTPHIAAAAVRSADWVRAHRMATRYQAVQPDRVESQRLTAWIEEREAGVEQLPLCPAPYALRPGRFTPQQQQKPDVVQTQTGAATTRVIQ